MGRRRNSPPFADLFVGLRNLKNVYAKATNGDLYFGIDYWFNLQSRIREEIWSPCNDSMKIKAGVFAALSPNNTEEATFIDTQNALYAYHGAPDDWKNLKVTTYPSNKDKAGRILAGGDLRLILRGPKTYSFYRNILDPSDPDFVTIDGHMVNAYNGVRVPLNNAGITRTQYKKIEYTVRQISDETQHLPNQIQVVIWLTWKRLHRIRYSSQLKLELR